jgi:hypothetical protein
MWPRGKYRLASLSWDHLSRCGWDVRELGELRGCGRLAIPESSRLGVASPLWHGNDTAWHHAGMTRPDPQTCEVKIQGAWRAVPLAEAAVDHVMAVKRCPACHGRVMILGTYSGPSGAAQEL